MELSAEMVSKITDKILPEIKEWQSRKVTKTKSVFPSDTSLKNAVSGIRKHHEKMDRAISWMGLGIGTVNHFVWRATNTIHVKKNESGTHYIGITTLILFLRH